MIWNINYLDNVEEWLDLLTKQQVKSVAKEIRLLELSGNELKLPHSKSLGSGLFELRERRFCLRIYYYFREGQIILLLLGGNKTTQEKDIKKARVLLSNFEG